MAVTQKSAIQSTFFKPLPPLFFGNLRNQNPAAGSRKRMSRRSISFARMNDHDGDTGHHNGRLVDTSLIVLRKRIHQTKIVEKNYAPPSHWMTWEKEWYTKYDSDVLELVGLLQVLLMNTRPSIALGMAFFAMFSVPISFLVVLRCLVGLLMGLWLMIEL